MLNDNSKTKLLRNNVSILKILRIRIKLSLKKQIPIKKVRDSRGGKIIWENEKNAEIC